MKVVAFSWKLLLDRIPTRSNLSRRNCLPPDMSTLCVLCGSSEESTNHLFLHCDFSASVWANVMSWLDFSFITPTNLFVHWECWSNEGGGRKFARVYGLFGMQLFRLFGKLGIIEFFKMKRDMSMIWWRKLLCCRDVGV